MNSRANKRANTMELVAEMRAVDADMLINVAMQRGAPWSSLMHGLNVANASHHQPGLIRREADYFGLLQNVSMAFQESDIAFEWGMRAGINARGIFGLVVMSARTMFDVVQVYSRYKSLLPAGLWVDHEITNGMLRLRTSVSDDLDFAVQRLLYERLATSCVNNWQALIGQDGRAQRCLSPGHAPLHRKAYLMHLSDDVRFDCDTFELIYPESVLTQPVLTHNPSITSQYERMLQNALVTQSRNAPFHQKVKSLLKGPGGDFRSLEDVSHLLGKSVRSVRRHLQSEGISFRDMIRDEKMRKAEQLLLNQGDSVEQVSSAAGFDNVAHFRKTFKTRTGASPGEWRRRMQAKKNM